MCVSLCLEKRREWFCAMENKAIELWFFNKMVSQIEIFNLDWIDVSKESRDWLIELMVLINSQTKPSIQSEPAVRYIELKYGIPFVLSKQRGESFIG